MSAAFNGYDPHNQQHSVSKQPCRIKAVQLSTTLGTHTDLYAAAIPPVL